MVAPTSNEEVDPHQAAPAGDYQPTLADLKTPLRMSRTAWLIAGMFLVAALSFFVLVVLLGVYTD
ncbi:MAG TPA: hypothetical protein VMW80_13565 [Candidatus Dormibacteraeota bacterium]|nr:hypothetical protein [Candidatus Dormibacteraeota bacterium]